VKVAPGLHISRLPRVRAAIAVIALDVSRRWLGECARAVIDEIASAAATSVMNACIDTSLARPAAALTLSPR